VRRSLGSLLSVSIVLIGCAGGDSKPARGDVLLTADRLFDGRRMIDDGAVLITGSKIVAAGTDLDDAEAKRRIDLGDATLLPGFIDLHVHREGGKGALARGVTTVRDLGAPLFVVARARPSPGALRVLHAGPILTAPGGYPIGRYPGLGLPFRDVKGAWKAVNIVADEGAVVVKLALEPGITTPYPVPSRQEVEAVVRAAHARKLRVTAHVSGQLGARLALDAGVDELAHMPCLVTEPGLLRELARKGVPVVGTLHVAVNLGCVPIANARVFVSAGGKLLYGSDYGNPRIPAGIDVEELKLMVLAGLTPAEAIAGATAEAGKLLGMEPLGTLVAGAPADVIAVRGDPLAQLHALDDRVLVVAGGRTVVSP